MDPATAPPSYPAPIPPQWQRVTRWAADHHGVREGLLALVGGFGAELLAAGLGVQRISVSLSDFHPEFVGRQYNWKKDGAPERIDRRYTPRRSDAYLQSPVKIIHDGAEAFRRRLTGPHAQADLPVLEEVRDAGATDFVAFPLKFTDGTRQYISFASDAPGGFPAAELAFLEDLLPLLCLRIEIEHARLVTDQLLTVYLGRTAAPRVLAGEMRRVRGETIEAVILAADMRDFTRLADTLSPDAVFAALSVFYDALAAPTAEAGGDVIKMIADGVLAVFPLPGDPSGQKGLAEKAARAAREAIGALAALTPEDLPPGVFPLRAGVALHEGRVPFGNVGSRDRLDFTLIGPAVNEAFRIEALTKTLGRPILLSAAFAQLLGGGCVSLGRHLLKGVGEPAEIFALA